MDFWNKILEEYDDIVYIPMSSGLSTSCDTATVLSEDFQVRCWSVASSGEMLAVSVS